jgi:hypothetical protein
MNIEIPKAFSSTFNNQWRSGVLDIEVVKGKCLFTMTPKSEKREKLIKNKKKNIWRKS